MENKDNEFKEKLLIWQEKEANFLKHINKLSKGHNKFLGVITKSEEENKKLSLSVACIQFQVKSLKEVCMNTKLQAKLKMNESETKYYKERIYCNWSFHQ
jgi:hypothetical protein